MIQKRDKINTNFEKKKEELFPPEKMENKKKGGYRIRTESPKRERDYQVGTHEEPSPARLQRHARVPNEQQRH